MLKFPPATSSKPRPGKISPKNLMPRQKVPKNLMTGQVFMSAKIENFQQVGDFFTLLHIFFVKNCKNLMPGQNLPPKT